MVSIEEIARTLWSVYQDSAGGNIKWSQLPEREKKNWRAVAKAVRDMAQSDEGDL